MANRAETITALREILNARGWASVWHSGSGILWKNGCLFVYGLYTDSRTKEDGCLQYVHCELGDVVAGASNTWYVERAGWLVGRGSISRSVSDAAVFGEGSSRWSEWLDIIDSIDKISEEDSFHLLMHKEGLMPTNVPAEKLVLHKHDGKVRDTGLFIVQKEYKGLMFGRVYQLLSVSKGSFQIAMLKKGGYEGEPLSAEGSTILKLEELGIISPVKAVTETYEVTVKKMRKLSRYKSVGLPEQCKRFGLNGQQLTMLSIALADCVNITPLLNRGLYAGIEFIEALRVSSQDLSGMLDCEISQQSTKLLAPIVRMGYNVTPYLSKVVDYNYTNLLYNDTMQALDELIGNMDVSNLSSDAMEALRRISTFGSIQGAGNSSSANELLLNFYAKQNGLTALAKELLQHGIDKGDTFFIRWSCITERKELFSFFSAAGLQLMDGESWGEFLEKVFERAMYLTFHKDLGLLISDNVGLIGRDYNGIVLYNQLFEPVWRAIKINEEFIKYGRVDL